MEFYTGEDLINYKPDTSYFIPWNIEMIYQVEPSLKEIVLKCKEYRKKPVSKRYDFYSDVKEETYKLVGWGARDPRLRSTGAYDYFIDRVIDELHI